MSDVDPDATLDATGLKCPLPVLKAKKAMRSVAPGEVLKVLATDPDSAKRLPALLHNDWRRAYQHLGASRHIHFLNS